MPERFKVTLSTNANNQYQLVRHQQEPATAPNGGDQLQQPLNGTQLEHLVGFNTHPFAGGRDLPRSANTACAAASAAAECQGQRHIVVDNHSPIRF
uniref:Uncharacterized protein n=1 Tax=Trichogramma kaykai TaxID=54128 RepID=A0ABD2XEX0_9HYME